MLLVETIHHSIFDVWKHMLVLHVGDCDLVFVIVIAGVIAYYNAYFGPGSGPILLDSFYCYTGFEPSLLDCSRYMGVSSACSHYDDAGISCQSKCILFVHFKNSFKEVNMNKYDCVSRHQQFMHIW